MKNVKLPYLLFFLIFIAIFTNCNKEEITNPIPTLACDQGLARYATDATNDNWEIDCSNCLIDCYEIYSDVIRYDYYYPVFNPKNNNEIAYLRFDNTTWGLAHDLWIFNFCTGEQKKIADNAAHSLSWSDKGWLLFGGVNQQLWKVKTNGDSLTQLTFSGDYNRFPKWNPSGDKYLYNTQTGSTGFYIIADEEGVPLDTLTEMASSGSYSWIDEQRIGFLIGTPSSTIILKYLDLTNNSVKTLLEMEHGMYNDSIVKSTAGFLAENSIVWCAKRVIGKTDINTGATASLKSGYANRQYQSLDVAGDQTKFLFSRQNINPVVDCKFDSEHRIYIMDTDGSNEQRIDIPEL
ncbi:MAG: TolB family protein [Saprospiraceae bacterium]